MLDRFNYRRTQQCPPIKKPPYSPLGEPSKKREKKYICPGKSNGQVKPDPLIDETPTKNLELKIPEKLKETLLRIYGGYIEIQINNENDPGRKRITIQHQNSQERSLGPNDFHHIIPQRLFTGKKRSSKSTNPLSLISNSLSIITRPVNELLDKFATSNEECLKGHYLLNLFPVSRSTHDSIEKLGYNHSSGKIDETLSSITLNQLFVYITFAMILSQKQLMQNIIESLREEIKILQNQRVMKRKRNKNNKLINLVSSIIAEIEFVINNASVIIYNQTFVIIYNWLQNNGLVNKSISELIYEYQLEQ